MKRINWKKLLPESDALIIQLGSYNGVECEEYGLNTVLKEQNHQAILVEPQSNVFAELVQNYKHASSRLSSQAQNSSFYFLTRLYKRVQKQDQA